MFSRHPIHRFGLFWALAVGLGSLAPGAAADGPVCGSPGKPPCPLQRWMRHALARPLAEQRLGELADGLDQLVALNPEPKQWKNWDKFARDGASAARAGRRATAIASCAHCHSIYRPEYNSKYRARPVE
jgi:cytochrome c553